MVKLSKEHMEEHMSMVKEQLHFVYSFQTQKNTWTLLPQQLATLRSKSAKRRAAKKAISNVLNGRSGTVSSGVCACKSPITNEHRVGTQGARVLSNSSWGG